MCLRLWLPSHIWKKHASPSPDVSSAPSLPRATGEMDLSQRHNSRCKGGATCWFGVKFMPKVILAGEENGIESSLSKSGPHSYSDSSGVHTLSAFLLFVSCVFVALPVPPLEGKLHEDRDRHMEITLC